MAKLIRLTEITNSGGNKTTTHPVLINPEYILGVSVSVYKNEGPHLIGITKTEEVRMIQLSAGRPVVVQETLEQIEEEVGIADMTSIPYDISRSNGHSA